MSEQQNKITVTHESSWGVWGKTTKGQSNGASDLEIYDQLKGTFGGQLLKHENGEFVFRTYN